MNTFTEVKTIVAVFTKPDPDNAPVLWGVFGNYPDAHTAVEGFVADRPYWEVADFTIEELPFGVLL